MEKRKLTPNMFCNWQTYQYCLWCLKQLGVLDIIHKAGTGALLSPSQIASQLRSLHNPEAPSVLDRMFRLLSAYSILTCSTIQANGKVIRAYGLAPVSKYFIKNQDGASLAPLLNLCHDKFILYSWYHLKDAVLEGGLPFSQAYGMNVVDYIGRDDRLGGVFQDSMKEFNLIFIKEILKIYTGFEGLSTLVDVGGGDGTILNMIICKHPVIKGINYDLPSVVENSPSHPSIEHIAADMFVRIPKSNAIFMKVRFLRIIRLLIYKVSSKANIYFG